VIKLLLTLLLLGTSSALAQTTYRLEILIDGDSVPWTAPSTATKTSETFTVPPGTDRITIGFAVGALELNLADIGTWDFAHVVGVEVRKVATDNYTFSATVRHNDQGWEHYANRWYVSGDEIQNGVRELLHPHDTEQPFTRSTSGVQATGTIVLVAEDTVHGAGGSKVTLDLERLPAGGLSLETRLVEVE
jgi:hypothetical protein